MVGMTFEFRSELGALGRQILAVLRVLRLVMHRTFNHQPESRKTSGDCNLLKTSSGFSVPALVRFLKAPPFLDSFVYFEARFLVLS